MSLGTSSSAAGTAVVSLAVPCRSDEPALARTLALALASWRAAAAAATHRLEVLVCLNGTDSTGPHRALEGLAAAARIDCPPFDADRPDRPPLPPLDRAVTGAALVTRRAGKALAWNVLRHAARGEVALFVDADVSFGRDAFGRLLGALAAHPEAVLASARTTCAPRAGVFERIMAAPYGVVFPNLSPQLYAARVAGLPAAMPEDLIEPERWLELTIGHERVVRAAGVEVAVRLPGTLRDFFRQRVRIEMGKVQLAREYPGLEVGSAPQPRAPAALRQLGATGSVPLAAYLALRSAAHTIAWWRYRRGRTAGIWVQAATTKRWDTA